MMKSLKNNEDMLFFDNFAYIEFLTEEVYLWLAFSFMELGSMEHITDKETFPGNFLVKKSIADKTTLQKEINKRAVLKKEQEKIAVSQGIPLNFLELCEKYRLNDIEGKIIQLLLIAGTTPGFTACIEQSGIDYWDNGIRHGEIELGVILSMLCSDYREQFACRSCFSIERPLVKYELIELGSSYSGFLITDVKLHERINRFCLNDNNVYDPELLCIHTEYPSVRLEQVIMDRELKSDLLHYMESFLNNSSKDQDLNRDFGYGTGLTCLFFGLSGTGKTMLAHSLANHLGCQLFSVNIGGLENENISFEDAIKHIFREAKLANGIVFLDECDDLLADSSHMSRTFLIEIEKAECITILATNKTVSLDPALDRRISLKVYFNLPDARERKAIWQALLPGNAKFHQDVNLADLSSRYKFTGGLIKNTLLMAVRNMMLQEDKENPGIVLSTAELHKAACHQAKSIFDLNGIGLLFSPKTRLKDLPLRRSDREKIANVAKIIPVAQKKKFGFCGLICSENIQTGLKCVEAIAGSRHLMVRKFLLSQLFSDEKSMELERGRILDPFTQQPINLLDYVFADRPGQQEIVMLADDAQFMKSALSSPANSEELPDAWLKFKRLLGRFRGILFVVSSQIKKSTVPIEFACHISLNYPAEDVQITLWQKHFPELSDDDVMGIVEHYPLHIPEIDLVARQTVLSASMDGIEQISTKEIIAMIRRLRGIRSTPFLFGEKRK